MKKQNINESLNKMKQLMEYHFKPSGAESKISEENPVDFNAIGVKYKDQENDFPSFEEYKNEVIDEDDPAGDEEKPEAIPAEQTPKAQPEPKQPAPQPAPEPQPQAQQPTVPDSSSATDELEIKLNNQIAKTDEILGKLSDLQNNLAAVQSMDAKISYVTKEVGELKNPSFDKQHDMISKNSYPYNTKLSDYWRWSDEQDNQEQPEQQYTLKPEDVNNYNTDEIKKSLGM